MIPSGDSIEYRRLRAPREHGGRFVDPPLASAPQWLAKNRELARQDDCDVQGRSARELGLAARRELVDLASRHTSGYADETLEALRDFAGPDPAPPLIVTGHQPHLFHPGVWYKNFAADAIARATGGIAVNLLIDNDTLRGATLKVPTGSAQEPRVEVAPFDRSTDEVPFEERRIVDPAAFRSFGERAGASLASLVPDALIAEVWPRVLAAARMTDNVGRCFAQARHGTERSWGVRTLEAPLSQLCDSHSFRWFAAHVLARADRFREAYDAALTEYRRVHRIRSRSHPVPDLATDGEWIEAPFWIWTSDEPRRRRLFARRVGRQVRLSDRQRIDFPLDLPADGSAETAVEQLDLQARAGVKVRPRAIMTTLFARLLASDLFLHGIGGAKYDQLTDALMRRFFGRVPPTFVTLTLTARLPIPHEEVARDDVRAATRRLRDLRFHPEQFVSDDADASLRTLVAEKQGWVDQHPPRGAGRPRQQALARLNATLAERLTARREELIEERDRLAVLAARHSLLASREYSFCLFPERTLRPLLGS